jgi:hypothetical protein
VVMRFNDLTEYVFHSKGYKINDFQKAGYTT